MTTTIVPQDVLDQYLIQSPVSPSEIAYTYRKVRAKLLNGHPFSPEDSRKLLMTAGAPGAGKSTHLRNKVAAAAKPGGVNYVRIDIDDIVTSFPSFEHTVAHLSEHFGGQSNKMHDDAFRDMRDGLVRPAKYIADRILNDCVYLGIPVAFETSAHNHRISNFFEKARDNGYEIELDLCDAPLHVKQQNLKRTGYEIDLDTIAMKSAAVLRNTQIYAQNADTLGFMWRDEVNSGLTLVATSTGDPKTSQIYDQSAAAAFNRAHNDTVTIARIMDLHAFSIAERKRAAAPTCRVA